MRKLFDRTGIGQMSVQNRFIRSAMTDRTIDGYVDDAMIKFYGKLSSGGVGTIVTGMTLVDGEEKLFPIVALCSDSFVSGHRKLVEAVHRFETRIIAQLACVGSYTTAGAGGGLVALAPSSVPNYVTRTPAREMRLGEIKLIQKKFADAAARARAAGYDGVELHCAHGLLMSQFLTPHYNNRSDDYGGPIENRSRMLTETCLAVRNSAGYDFPLWVKLNSVDGIPDGITEEDFVAACGELAKAGVDAIEVSGNWIPDNSEPGAYFKDAAAYAADETSVPIILTGGNRKISEMTEILNNTRIQFFGIARPFSRDPDLIYRFSSEEGR
jgi:2,4-dienoyl-CoA reductase-like NADH-dependent reductase (Old Yellow Enzyme family)